MSDVTAVLLTIGEPSTERALESIRRQSLPAADVVVVRSEFPFHRALNAGVRRVRTDFFVQVDADMVLDPGCFAGLRACMREEVGVATGRLRDPLLGRIGSVRMTRTRCFAELALPDTLSPDTDFFEAMQARGWRRLDALGHRDGPRELWHTFGEHRPEYTPLYTFSKFRLDGARYRYRRDPYTLRRQIVRLLCSPHPAARLALVALAHGAFRRDAGDQLRPYEEDSELAIARSMVDGAAAGGESELESAITRDLESVFQRAAALGARLASHGDGDGFAAALEVLGARAADDPASLVGLLALCHGIFAPRAACDVRSDYGLLDGWFPALEWIRAD